MLSTTDRIEILQLHARYCACLDTGDAQGWARCFTVDGEFGVCNMHRGRDRLAVHCADVVARRRANPWDNVQHWNGNIIVEGGAGRDHAMSYPATLGRQRDSGAQAIVANGWYRDTLAQEDGAWKLSSRRIAFETPASVIIPQRC
ncbi:MAG: nuclear transport factor 2 family protein [Betaproteobacteria bacterium]|nr:nuclear transport factor 2 family protein [Betaproteobacteria bacterium]